MVGVELQAVVAGLVAGSAAVDDEGVNGGLNETARARTSAVLVVVPVGKVASETGEVTVHVGCWLLQSVLCRCCKHCLVHGAERWRGGNEGVSRGAEKLLRYETGLWWLASPLVTVILTEADDVLMPVILKETLVKMKVPDVNG